MILREKGRDLSAFIKAPTPTETPKKQRDTIQNTTKNLIIQRLRID